MASAIGRRQLPLRTAPACAARFASSTAEKPSSTNIDDFSELDSASSFTTPPPDSKVIEAFNSAQPAQKREKQLPGTRYLALARDKSTKALTNNALDTSTTLQNTTVVLYTLFRAPPRLIPSLETMCPVPSAYLG